MLFPQSSEDLALLRVPRLPTGTFEFLSISNLSKFGGTTSHEKLFPVCRNPSMWRFMSVLGLSSVHTFPRSRYGDVGRVTKRCWVKSTN